MDESNVTNLEVIKPEQETQHKSTDIVQTIDFDNLYKDKDFKRKLDNYTRKSNETAVSTALENYRAINDMSLPEDVRISRMTAEQRAAYFEKKYKDSEDKHKQEMEMERLKLLAINSLSEKQIPLLFLDMFRLDKADDSYIEERLNVLSEYEYFPKGAYDKAVADGIRDGLNKRLGNQRIPETHTKKSTTKDPFEEKAKKYEKNKR